MGMTARGYTGIAGSKALNLTVTVVVACLAFIYMSALPRHDNDIWFLMQLLEWLGGHGVENLDAGVNLMETGIPWREIIETWKFHYENDVIRLGNDFLPFLLLLPPWVGGLMMTFCLVYSLRAMCALSGILYLRSALTPVLIFFVTWTFPWRENMAQLAFQINYLAPAALCLCLLLYLRDHGGKGVGAQAGAFLLGLAAGLWHEGFAVPVGVGLGVLAVSFRKFRNAVTWEAIGGLLVGTALLMTAPGIYRRIEESPETLPVWVVHAVIFNAWPFLGGVLMTVASGLRLGWRRVWRNPLNVFCVVSGLISMAVCLGSTTAMRAELWAILMGSVLALHTLESSAPLFWERVTLRNALPVTFALGMTLWFWITAAWYAVEIRRDSYARFAEWKERPGETRWSCLTERKDYPMVVSMIYFRDWYDGIYSYLYGYDSYLSTGDHEAPRRYGSYIDPVARELRYVTPGSGTPVPGGSGIRIKDGRLFKSADADMENELRHADRSVAHITLPVDFGKGYVNVRTCQISFRSEGDGGLYYYYVPETYWYVTFFKRMRAIGPGVEIYEFP